MFLSLSDERTYALMEEAAREADIEIGSLGFSDMMDLVTERLRENVPLPTFEEFREQYREHPERFDAVLLEPSADEPADSGDIDDTDDTEEADEADA